MVSDVVHDSRSASEDTLFVAIRGLASDGHRYVAQAVELGAPAVCVQELQDVATAQLVVEDTRAALPRLAAEVHGHPSHKMKVVGVTGTNGKTTVTYMLESIASVAGKAAGRIGTIGARSAGRDVPLERTTPEASDLQRLLAGMVVDGVSLVAMEVSSHAMQLGRVAGILFSVAAFTNLSVDHLDFHADLDEYFETKARLFDGAAATVIFRSPWGDRLAERHPDALLVGPGGTITAEAIVESASSSRFDLVTPRGRASVELPLAGQFNVSNALVAAGCAQQLGFSLDAIAQGLAALEPVPGRMERVQQGQAFDVYVDYAHTPEGIEVAIDAARRFTVGRVVVVVGAGGDRDVSKRPMMGRAAAAADTVWITSDNPRSESPERIIDQVRAGVPSESHVNVEADRRLAITRAIADASPGDTILILGKGHEQGQDVDGTVTPFDDRAVAAEAIAGTGS